MFSRADYRLAIRPHLRPRNLDANVPLPISGITSVSRSRAIDRGGSWGATLKATAATAETLQRYVRDDDWVDLTLTNPDQPKGRASSPFLGLVDEVRLEERIDPNTGALRKVWSLAGRDWSKALTGSQIRIGAMLSGAVGRTVRQPTVPITAPVEPRDSVLLSSAPSFQSASGRALKWLLLTQTGTADNPAGWEATIQSVWAVLGASPSPFHFVITQSGVAWSALSDPKRARFAIADASVSALDREAVVIALVGAHGANPTAAQLDKLGDLSRWLASTQDLKLFRGVVNVVGGNPESSPPVFGATYRWDADGPVSPAGGILGRSEVYPGAGLPLWTDGSWDESVWAQIMAALNGVREETTFTLPPNIPGIIPAERWGELMATLATAYNPEGKASEFLQNLLRKLLPGLFTDAAGKDLLSRMSWSRWGTVHGVPYRALSACAGQPLVSPDALFRQLACEPYNEIFYDYNHATGAPAIVYRPRPYGIADANAGEPFAIRPDWITGIDISRSGSERYTFWRPTPVLGSVRGVDITVDTAEGRTPIIDIPEIRKHGLRVADPGDDYIPPLDSATDLLAYYRKRIATFRGWYYHSAEMLTGSVYCKPALPGLRLGEYVKIPVSWWFANQETKAPYILGYVVEINDGFVIDPETGAKVSSCSFAFIRGQPPGGLSVPKDVSWITGD